MLFIKQIQYCICMSTDGKDLAGFQLFDKEVLLDIWEQQRQHLPCLQDPDDVQLYKCTGHQKVGGKKLPIYRCGRGSTSLECAHKYIAQFVPGQFAFFSL